MTTDIKMFDDRTDLPTTGHSITERSEQVTLVTNKFVDVNTAVLDFADASGILAEWAAELYTGYVQSSVVATPENTPQQVRDQIGDEVALVIYVAPVYWVPSAATRDYLVKHEAIDPYVFDVGVDVVVV